ncbi:hypothetical protein HPB51_005274 [Rhipicephalus microplus]|uniref:Reverse transcriptase domain-containing protein n=1 Tax=Rhipicephalus microplus TaxID=6941 RepID=A0A9J6DFW2_RHIMP|nr:hypothetical protein HPB51_005274 [Rhipicephalus microplus]
MQDVLLQFNEQVLGSSRGVRTRALIALHPKSVFDDVEHDLILSNLAESHRGVRLYNYVRAFLRDRTATIVIRLNRVSVIHLPGRGTSQVAVISPALFEINMSGLPKQLDQIEDLLHTIYADYIMSRAFWGSDDEILNQLQQAVVVSEYAERGGLTCAPNKTELLVFRSGRKTPPPHIIVLV